MVRLVISTGGSVGHLAPAVAVWRALQRMQPDATVHVLCSDRRAEADYLHYENVPFTALPLPRRSSSLPGSLARGFSTARRCLRDQRATVLFSKGSAVSVAPAVAARAAGIPVVLHESDVVMGRANRCISSIAQTICLGWSDAHAHERRTYTGNPVRPQVTMGSRAEGLRITGFTGERPILLVMGGSQGAQAVNDAIASMLHPLLELADVVHLTGEGKAVGHARPGYLPLPFVTAELPHLYAIATVAVSRAGAGSIAELAANAVPTILVPIRGLAQDHQYRNALAAQRQAGCAVLAQEALLHDLLPLLGAWLHDRPTLEQKRSNMRTLHQPDAAERIARAIVDASR